MGYAAIAVEHSIHVNKAASALITGDYAGSFTYSGIQERLVWHLGHHLGPISGIIFFLLVAMTIELVDTHCGFEVITTE